MKSIALVICFALCTIVSSAQSNSIEIARIEFRKGNYKDAVGMFNGAIATIVDSNIKKKLIAEKEKSGKCWRNIELANRYFWESNFELAQRYYENVLSYNSSDSYAKNQKNICVENIKTARLLALEKKRIDALWIELISLNNLVGLKAFIKDYPNYDKIKDIKKILEYFDDPKKIDKSSVFARKTFYIESGNLYYDYNKTVASEFYEKAAILGSLTGFYNLALSIQKSDKNREQRLLAFAAANGMENAKKRIDEKYPDLKYNQEIPKSLYQSLQQANRGDVAAQICIHKNKFNIALPNLYLLDDQTAYKSDEDDWQYELGMMYLNGIYVKEDYFKGLSYLKDAAVKGNYTAQYQLVTTKRDHKEPINNALVLCAAINGCKQAQTECGSNYDGPIFVQAKEYIKYLQGLPYDFDDMNRFLYLDADKYNSTDNDARLIGAASNPNSRYDLKKINTLLQIQATWSKATISKIQRGLRSTSNKFHHKLFKKLEKISTSEYETKTNALQLLVNEGYFSNPHAAKEIDVIDFMSTSSAHQEASTVVRKEKQETIHKAQNQNEAYYKKSPRSNMSIGEAQGWCERLGSGWRMATAMEIRRIPHLYGRFWTNGGIRGVLVDSEGNSAMSNNPNDRAGAIAVKLIE